MSLLDTTAFTQPAKPVVPDHVAPAVSIYAVTEEGDYSLGAKWQDFDPDEIAADLSPVRRQMIETIKPHTLLVGQKVGRLLRLDYAPLERRALAHYVDIETIIPQAPSGDPVKACTRRMNRFPEWAEFVERVERRPGLPRDPYLEWLFAHDRMTDEWTDYIRVLRTTDLETEIEDVRGKRPKFDPVPHQTTGAEALAMWRN